MKTSESQVDEFRSVLRTHSAPYEVQLRQADIARLGSYYELLLAWNPRLHLVALCSPAEFATRHVLESLLLLPHLEQNARIADVGSGAGLPIIPNLIVRRDIQATLIESSKKKCVFLREALRAIKTSEQAKVIVERFEGLPTPEVDYVTCRALDRFSEMLPKLIKWSPQTCTFLLFGGSQLRNEIERAGLRFLARRIPDSERRFLFVLSQNRMP